MPPFCTAVWGVGDRMVEVLAETTVPDMRICVSDDNASGNNADPATVSRCGMGTVSACVPAKSSNVMQLVFYCDKDCPTHDYSFWYRIRVSPVTFSQDQGPNSASNNINMWCAMLNQATGPGPKYPSDLDTSLSPDVVVPNYDLFAADTGAASQRAALPSVLALAVISLAVACIGMAA